MSFSLQEPARWTYDVDPATGNSRASYPGEVIVAGNPIGGPVTGTGAQVLQNAPTINDATLVGPVALNNAAGGLAFGTTLGTSNSDISHHLELFAASFGLGITSNRLNYVVGLNSAHVFVVNSNDVVEVTAAGITVLSTTANPVQYVSQVNGVTTGLMHSDSNWGLLLQGLAGSAADIAFLSRSGVPQIRILSTGEVQIVGVTGATNAPAGDIGEYLSATRLVGTAVPITTSTITDILALSLTAGDWDVNANIVFQGAGGTLQQSATCWLNTVSITQPTLPNSGGESIWVGTQPAANATMALPIGPMRINVAATTTVFLSCSTVFASGTLSGYGFIGARRAR